MKKKKTKRITLNTILVIYFLKDIALITDMINELVKEFIDVLASDEKVSTPPPLEGVEEEVKKEQKSKS